MKAILMSIKPKHCANILNGLKTREIRKFFTKDYRGWIYIYCTKDKDNLILNDIGDIVIDNEHYCNVDTHYNGKVIARFYCNNVDRTYNYYLEELLALSCLTEDELLKYAGGTYDKLDELFAINITNLEIFDTPKELSEFKKCYRSKGYPQNQSWYLTKAPQNLMYIEIDETR